VLSNNPVRSANCIANGIVKILKMNVTMDTLVKNPEVKQLLERRRKQLQKQDRAKGKAGSGIASDEEEQEEEDSAPGDDDEPDSPRAHAHDYEQYEHDLIAALDDALDTRSNQVNRARSMNVKKKEEAFIKARLHADETAKGRVDVLTGELEGSGPASFQGYDAYIEDGIGFSDDSDSEDDDGLDDIVASALKSVRKAQTKNEKTRKGKKETGKDSKHHHRRHHHHNQKEKKTKVQKSPPEELAERAHALTPPDRQAQWAGFKLEATALLINAIRVQDDVAMARAMLEALAQRPLQARTDLLKWTAQEHLPALLDVDSVDRHGLSALHHAAHRGNLKMLELLVDQWGADIGAQHYGYSVWQHALNSVSKGLGCTQQVLDWLKIKGAEEHAGGIVAEYTEEIRAEWEAEKERMAKAAKKREKVQRKEAERQKRKEKHRKEKELGGGGGSGGGEGEEAVKEEGRHHHHHHHSNNKHSHKHSSHKHQKNRHKHKHKH
jgi:hypothetical protein